MAGQPLLFCGSGLAREEVGSVDAAATARTLSRASPLPHSNTPPPMAGQPPLFCGSGLAKRLGQSMQRQLPGRFREQARSHTEIRRAADGRPAVALLWERACSRRGWVGQCSGNCQDAFASKPAPTLKTSRRQWPVSRRSSVRAGLLAKRLGQSMQRQLTGRFREQARSHTENVAPPMAGQPSLFCGSGLAREEAGSVDAAATDRTLSRASPLPHSNAPRRRWPASRRSSVGAGLLAKGPGQAAKRLALEQPGPIISGQKPFRAAILGPGSLIGFAHA